MTTRQLAGWLNLFGTPFDANVLGVKIHMVGVVRKQLKVFNTVIECVSVFVVDNLFAGEVSAKMLLHNKAMLSDTFVCRCKRMIRAIDKSVASVYSHATLPARVFFSLPGKCFQSHLFQCLNGINSRPAFIPGLHESFRSLIPRWHAARIKEWFSSHRCSLALSRAIFASFGLACRDAKDGIACWAS